MKKEQKIGWDLPFTPNITEANEFIKKEFDDPELKGMLLFYTDVDGNTKLWKGLKDSGFETRYFLNEQLDTQSLKLHSPVFLEDGITLDTNVVKRKIPNMAKAIVVYEVHATEEFKLEYDENGMPSNHDQFYIYAGRCSQSNTDEKYEHQYDLVEPIEITKRIICETRDFANIESIDVADAATNIRKTFTQEPTDLYYMFTDILKTTGIKTNSEDTSWYSKIKIMDKELLKANAIGTNQTFNSCSLYENLFQIGKMIKRYPILLFNPKFDMSKDRWEDANEDYREFLLYYVRYDGIGMPVLSMADFMEESGGWCETQGKERDEGTVISETQNMRPNQPIWYPAKGYYVAIQSTDDSQILFTQNDIGILSSFGVWENFNDKACIRLPNNIEKILKIKCFIGSADPTGPNNKNELAIFNYPVMPKEDWRFLNANEKKKTLYYEKGSNLIKGFDISIINDHTISGWYSRSFSFSIQYIPLINQRIPKHSNNKLQKNIAQLNPQVDSDLWGTYLENYAEENNGYELTTVRTFTKYADIWKLGTNVISDDGTLYVISDISIAKHNSVYTCQFTANDNNIKRSMLVDTSSTFKISYLDSGKAQLRLSNIEENPIRMFFGEENIQSEPRYFKHLEWYTNIDYFFGNFYAAETYITVPEIAFMRIVPTTKDESILYRALPIARSVVGTSITFNISAIDNLWLTYAGGWNYDSLGIDDSFNHRYVKYGDAFSKISEINIKIGGFKDDFIFGRDQEIHLSGQSQTGGVDRNWTIINNARIEFRTFTDNFPIITQSDYDNANQLASIRGYRYLKNTNEIMNITYQINFIPYDNSVIINKEFLENMPLISSRQDMDYRIVIIRKQYAIGTNEKPIFYENRFVDFNIVRSADNELKNSYLEIINEQYPFNLSSGDQAALVIFNADGYIENVLIVFTCYQEITTNKLYLRLMP